MQNKKIVQVLYSGLGGHGTVAFSLLDGFIKSSFENSLIFYGVETINKSYIEQINLTKDTSYFGIKKETKTGVKEWIQYYKSLKQIKPNIILLHSNQLILTSFFYSLFYKTKIITVEHDAISVRTKSKWVVSNLNAIFANRIIVLSKSYKNHIKTNLWFKKLLKKYVIIPNGISINKFKQKEHYFSNKDTTLFMASRMNKLRDHKTLIEAVHLAYNKNNNIKLRIAGDGDTLESLKNECTELPFIQFLGNINQSEIINELNNSDIYIHATFAETFSTAILQAMSTGLPIICSDIEGTRHMIIDNYNGLLYKSKNSQDLCLKIEMLLNNKEKAIMLGNNARKDVVNNYSNEEVNNRYLKLF